ncbi:hypothetical protein ACXX9E_28550 [Pseudomonas sp. GNP014]
MDRTLLDPVSQIISWPQELPQRYADLHGEPGDGRDGIQPLFDDAGQLQRQSPGSLERRSETIGELLGNGASYRVAP